MAPILKRPLLFVLGFVVASLSVVAICLLFLTDRADVWMTPEKISHIQAGMSLSDVEKIIGLPPGDYSPGQEFGVAAHAGGQAPAPHWKNWGGKHWIISVEFDKEGMVSRAAILKRGSISSMKGNQTFWKRLRARMGI